MRSAAAEQVVGAAVGGFVVISGNLKHLSHHRSLPLHSGFDPLILNHRQLAPFTAIALISRPEQKSLNQRVQGSSPCAPTKLFLHITQLSEMHKTLCGPPLGSGPVADPTSINFSQ